MSRTAKRDGPKTPSKDMDAKLMAKTVRAFQTMIRAEHGAAEREVLAMVDHVPAMVESPAGSCVCVTCGAVKPWSAPKSMGIDSIDAGHFLPKKVGRKYLGACLMEVNCHPQCSRCNNYLKGNIPQYAMYMVGRYGTGMIVDLAKQNSQAMRADRQWLTDCLDEFKSRTNEAVALMRCN